VEALVQPLQRLIVPLFDFASCRSNHCRPKRLKPDQQIQPVRLQCVETRKRYRSATGLTATVATTIRAVTNPE
jgi:hypothetical protein